jgi:hypothetical protein
VNAFTLLFILALAIERLIQPFSPLLGPDSTEPKARLRVADANPGMPPAKAGKVETKPNLEAQVNDCRAKTAIVTWVRRPVWLLLRPWD